MVSGDSTPMPQAIEWKSRARDADMGTAWGQAERARDGMARQRARAWRWKRGGLDAEFGGEAAEKSRGGAPWSGGAETGTSKRIRLEWIKFLEETNVCSYLMQRDRNQMTKMDVGLL